MIAVISDVHFPSNAERQKIMETGLKKLTGIRALFICGDFTDNRKDTKPEEEMKFTSLARCAYSAASAPS